MFEEAVLMAGALGVSIRVSGFSFGFSSVTEKAACADGFADWVAGDAAPVDSMAVSSMGLLNDAPVKDARRSGYGFVS